MIYDVFDDSKVEYLPPVPAPPRPLADPNAAVSAIELLKNARSPLVVIGKVSRLPFLYSVPLFNFTIHLQGAAYAGAEDEIRHFV